MENGNGKKPKTSLGRKETFKDLSLPLNAVVLALILQVRHVQSLPMWCHASTSYAPIEAPLGERVLGA